MVDDEQVDSTLIITPVSLEHLGPFLYLPNPLGGKLLSQSILSPGEYGCFVIGSLVLVLACCLTYVHPNRQQNGLSDTI